MRINKRFLVLISVLLSIALFQQAFAAEKS